MLAAGAPREGRAREGEGGEQREVERTFDRRA
jgi:hypothetical protein